MDVSKVRRIIAEMKEKDFDFDEKGLEDSAKPNTQATDELIENVLGETKQRILNDSSISSQNKNKRIVEELYAKGIFNIKDAVIKVAGLLGISKNTVYMHCLLYTSRCV